MKKLFYLTLATVAFASCSQDETMEVIAPEAINFNQAFIDKATKAIDPSIRTNTINEFQVYGTTKGDETDAALVQIFEHITVNNTSGDWAYANEYTQYWIKDNTYNFAALVNAENTNVTLGDDKLPQTVTFTTTDDATDLLYARSNQITGKASGNDRVAFTFEHLLSKVHFTVKNTMTSNTNDVKYTYRVSDIQITNAYKTGTCTVVSKEWNSQSNKGSVAFGHVTNTTDANTAIEIGQVGATDERTSHYARLLVPSTYENLNVTCTIETLLNGTVVDKQSYNKNVKITLAASTAYNFVISLGNPGEKIEFTVTEIKGWSDPITDEEL